MSTTKRARRAVTPAPDETLPWERQPNESEEAYRAFVIYRDMGTARSLRNAAPRVIVQYQDDARAKLAELLELQQQGLQVDSTRIARAQALTAGPNTSTIVARISVWSASLDWIERCRLWDVQQQRLLDAQKQTQRDSLKRDHANVSRTLLAAASRLIQPPRDLVEKAERGDAQAKKQLENWRPHANDLRSASDGIKSAVHTGRLSLDMPTEITRAEVLLKTQLAEAVEVNGALLRVLEEHTCDDCKDRVIAELERVARLHQQTAASVATLG